MNKRQKPSKSRKGAGITLAVCMAAAVVMAGTYTLQNYQEAKQQEKELAQKDTDTKEDLPKEETGSDLVVNTTEETQENDVQTEGQDTAAAAPEEPSAALSGTSASSQTAGNAANVNFNGESVLLWPVDGNIIMNYSMDKTVYFSTLDQYKYNPALIISGAEGDQVISSTTGIVKSIDENPQTGTTVNIDIGNGYELFYGQLKDVTVSTGDYVEAKTVIGYVSQPTKYYSLEGCNVYFEMRKDGQPVNPVDYMAD